MSSSKDPVTRVIGLSIVASLIWGVGALTVGLLVGSQTIIFDGMYSFVVLALSLLSLAAARAIRKGPSDRYPFGRQPLEPMANIVRAVGLSGLVLYAISNAVLDVIAGGNPINYGWALIYGVVTAAGSAAIALHIHRRRRSIGSGLVGGEATNWLMDSLTSVGVMIGFGVGFVLQQMGNDQAAAYVDPVVLILFSVAALVLPLRMGIGSFRDLVAASPSSVVLQDVRDRVTDLERRHRFAESFCRVGQVSGDQLDVEVYFIVDDATPARDVEAFDEIRRKLDDSLDEVGYEIWWTASFTTDRGFALDPPAE